MELFLNMNIDKRKFLQESDHPSAHIFEKKTLGTMMVLMLAFPIIIIIIWENNG